MDSLLVKRFNTPTTAENSHMVIVQQNAQEMMPAHFGLLMVSIIRGAIIWKTSWVDQGHIHSSSLCSPFFGLTKFIINCDSN